MGAAGAERRRQPRGRSGGRGGAARHLELGLLGGSVEELLPVDRHELHVEAQVRVRRDVGAGAARAVAHVAADVEHTALAQGHLDDALVPPLDHLAHADRELEDAAPWRSRAGPVWGAAGGHWHVELRPPTHHPPLTQT